METTNEGPITNFKADDIDLIAKRIRLAPRLALSKLKNQPGSEDKPVKRAGVVLPLGFDLEGHPSILFTLRSKHVGTHKGEVGFPGGRMELSDPTIEECAIRELEEEIGLPRARVKVLGKLNDAVSITGIVVTPVVGFMGTLQVAEMSPSSHEIDQIFVVRLSDLTNPKNISWTNLSRGNIPVFQVNDFPPIWGLTAYILQHFFKSILRIELPQSPPEPKL